MISWLEFLILSLLIAWSEALADKGAWNFMEMRVEVIYQLGSSFCVHHRRDGGDIKQDFFSAHPCLLSSLDQSMQLSCLGWCGHLVSSCMAPKSTWGLREGPTCRWGPSVPLGWWQDRLGPKKQLIKLHSQVEHAVSAGHCISILKIFLRFIFRFPQPTRDRFLWVSSLDALMASWDGLSLCFSSRGYILPYSKWRVFLYLL